MIAFNGDVPVGYVRMREGKKFPEFENRDSIEIARIYSVNTYLGTGVGQQLMRQCIFIAKELKKRDHLAWSMEEKPPGYCFLHKVGV